MCAIGPKEEEGLGEPADAEEEAGRRERWGGEVALADGSSYYLEPLSAPPKLPITLRAKRAGEG